MAQIVQPPARQPRIGGIKDITEFITVDRIGGPSELVWEDSTCGLPAQTRADCWDVNLPDQDKTFDGVEQYSQAVPTFAQYAGVDCWIGGDSIGDSYLEQAKKKLLAGEDVLVEARIAEWVGTSPALPQPDIVSAIGAADERARFYYTGRPVLVMNPKMAARAYSERALTREGGKLVSANGTPVLTISDGGGDWSADTNIGIIGQPAVWVTSIAASQAVDPASNREVALAERKYAIGIDCDFVARYEITT